MTAASEPAARRGYRGYIASRPVRGVLTPQHVQNLVIRDYAERHGLSYKLSATEYIMPGCTMMLNAVLDELTGLEGLICFSLFMLPDDATKRRAAYARVLDQGASLHAALESLVLSGPADIERFEDIFLVEQFAAQDLAPVESWLTSTS